MNKINEVGRLEFRIKWHRASSTYRRFKVLGNLLLLIRGAMASLQQVYSVVYQIPFCVKIYKIGQYRNRNIVVIILKEKKVNYIVHTLFDYIATLGR
jgi:hypothetical protein